MAENLFPDGYEEEIVTQEDLVAGKPTGYRNGIAFDSMLGDFLRDGMHKILDSDGTESWKSWCINCLQTERYKHLAYSTDFGIEIDKAMRAGSREEAESILARQITEAFLADPYKRTKYIESIAFDWTAPDTVRVDITVHGRDWTTIDITAYITKASNTNPTQPQPGESGGLKVSSDGVGAVSIESPALSVASDGAGNVTITGVAVASDGVGNVTLSEKKEG